MKFFSTRKNSPVVPFRAALFNGQAPDGGLYFPTKFPLIDQTALLDYRDRPYQETAFYLLDQMIGDEFSPGGLETVVEQAYDFAPAMAQLSEHLAILELFHGPTLSFKDFGAQFMAKSMGYFLRHESREITILVATSGDTGSAVAHAYHNVPGIRIVLLYPAGKVSLTQEKQFTTLGDNITALEVEGTFDDCQALVKKAFRDSDVAARLVLSSANSINIGRLLPQSIYYFWSAMQIQATCNADPIICVPSGNFGNICAGMFAQRMGAPIARFIAAVNANEVIAHYVRTGAYLPRPSIRTLSNAMDVGAPSNWERIRVLFDDDYEEIIKKMWSTSISDAATIEAMQRIFNEYSYIADPHTSVGLQAVQKYSHEFGASDDPVLVLATAHPGKFHEIVVKALAKKIELPQSLQDSLKRSKQTIHMSTRFDDFKQFLWEIN